MMTKQDFVGLADAIRPWYEEGGAEWNADAHGAILAALVDFCERANPKFKRERWLEYVAGKVGVNGGAR